MSKTITTIKYGLIYTLILLAILVLGAITFMAREANADETATYQAYNSQPWVENEAPLKNPTPVVNSLSPNSANLGSGSRNVTITGSGFVNDSVARWNGSDRPTTFIDSSHLLISLRGTDMTGSAGKYITVFNPEPKGGYSNASFFTINGYVAPAGSKATTTKSSTSTSGASSKSSTGNNSGSVLGADNSNNTSTNDSFNSLTSNALFGAGTFLPSGIIQWLLFAIFILLVVIIIRKIFFADRYHSTPLKHA
ncbi:MAG: IPT/TIG domain-containing protein [Candidatus Pacebacteria bacterium]|nr:IPT/TIG domain-containing protein [Candidatus Paceibacterota bacterium]